MTSESVRCAPFPDSASQRTGPSIALDARICITSSGINPPKSRPGTSVAWDGLPPQTEADYTSVFISSSVGLGHLLFGRARPSGCIVISVRHRLWLPIARARAWVHCLVRHGGGATE